MLAIVKTSVYCIILTSPFKYAIAGFHCSLDPRHYGFVKNSSFLNDELIDLCVRICDEKAEKDRGDAPLIKRVI